LITAASTRSATASGMPTLFAHVVPPVGGETEFADLRATYDALAAAPRIAAGPMTIPSTRATCGA
jgi:hypothetical protein